MCWFCGTKRTWMLNQKLKDGRIALATIKNNKRKIHILAVYYMLLRYKIPKKNHRTGTWWPSYTIKLKLPKHDILFIGEDLKVRLILKINWKYWMYRHNMHNILYGKGKRNSSGRILTVDLSTRKDLYCISNMYFQQKLAHKRIAPTT